MQEQSRIVAGAIDKEHLELLERVLRCLDSYNLTLHKKKCAFFQKEITYCGYRVDGEGLQKTPERSRAVVDAPSLGNLSQLRAFLDKLLPQVSSRSVNTAGTLTSSTTDKYIYGHVWNELGSEGAPKKIIISTWNHSMSVDDHARKQWHLSETTGESETSTRTVPRTQMIIA